MGMEMGEWGQEWGQTGNGNGDRLVWTPKLRQSKQGHFTVNGEESLMVDQRRNRFHRPEFRVEIVERMQAGENLAALASQYGLARSMMYRWRDTYGMRMGMGTD